MLVVDLLLPAFNTITEKISTWEGRNQDEIVQFQHLGVNYDMIELLDIQLAEGRSFSRAFPSDTTAIILNEAAIDVMGLKDPVGKIFNLWGNKMEIIGIVKDFHFQSLHQTVSPFFLRLKPREADQVMLKIEKGREAETLDRIQTLYAKVNPGYGLDYQFLDQDYQALYEGENRIASLSKCFAGLAIGISCLGLFAGAGVIVIAIAWLTVSAQSFRAATINPATCLKNE